MEEVLRKIKEANPSIEHEDLMEVIPLIQKIEPKVILEIGTHLGGSAKLWVDVFNPDIMVTIDNTGKPPEARTLEGDNYHYLWEHDSTTDETEKAIKNIIGDKSVDYLFIDGGHTLDVVKNDVKRYFPLVREGGVVGFHDIHESSDQCQVPLVWDKLKNKFDTVESHKGEHSTGFGLLYKK